MENGQKGALALGIVGLAVIIISAITKEVEAAPPEEEEEEEIIDAEFKSGYVLWAGLTEWKRVYTKYPNEWPADTDITFAWKIKNTGNVGAYFQVYIFSPSDWLYLAPNDELQVFESFYTPAIPVTPGYEYYRITILGRKVTGERIGAVWTSEEIEVTYV